MVWCSRHGFLKNVQSSYSSFSSWALHVCERKTAAVKRAWPDISSYSEDSAGSHGSLLFIEQALSNLGIEQSYTEEREEVDISCLQDGNSPLYFRSRINETNMNQVVASYPFANVRAAADILFLHGTSDMVVAKRAIFLYYLFDRHWTRPAGEWKHLVEDFAISFESQVVEMATEVAKEGGEAWKSLTDEEKKPYQDRAAELKAEYERSKEKLNAENEEGNEENEKEGSDKYRW